MTNSRVKFAVIGCGSIGKRHVAVLDAESDAEVVGLCDIEETRARELSDLYGGIPVWTDYHKMLEQCDADVITIATPHALHAEMAIQTARSGKHILVEKPMALSVEDSQSMIDAAEEHSVRLFVVKQNRYNVPVRLTRNVIDSGKLGKIFMVQCNVFWNRRQEYYDSSDWRGKIESEGGALQTQVSHFIDLLVWWFGDIVDAKTLTDTLNHDIEIEDVGVSAMRFDSGVIGSLNWTTCVYNQNLEGSILIIAEFGTIKIGGKYLNEIKFWDVHGVDLPPNEDFNDKPNSYGKYNGSSSNHDKLIHQICDQLLKNKTGAVEGEEAIRTINAIDVIYAGDDGLNHNRSTSIDCNSGIN